MARFARAEDFSVDELRIVIGERNLTGNAVLSVHAERRVSVELLGLFAFGLLFAILGLSDANQPLFSGTIVAISWYGAIRELRRAWVLVFDIYQIGGFEVRGFTELEAEVGRVLVDRLRCGVSGVMGRVGP